MSGSGRDSGSDGVGFGVAHGEGPGGDAQVLGYFGGAAGDGERGLAAGEENDFNIGPADPILPAGAEGFQDGFLGSGT